MAQLCKDALATKTIKTIDLSLFLVAFRSANIVS